MSLVRIVAIVGLMFAAVPPLAAQQVSVGSPFHSVNDGFFENIGVGFGFHIGNFFFMQNGANLAVPQFGGFQPGAGANFGWGWQKGNAGGFFNVSAGQGSTSGFVSQSPSVTLSNGVPGGFFAGSVTPFVISTIPFAGGPFPGAPMVGGPAVSPIQERVQRLKEEGVTLGGGRAGGAAPPAPVDAGPKDVFAQRLAAAHAGAAQPTRSVAEIKAAREAQQDHQDSSADAEVQRLLAHARRAEADGKAAVAKIYYQQAARRASGPLRDEILAHSRASH